MHNKLACIHVPPARCDSYTDRSVSMNRPLYRSARTAPRSNALRPHYFHGRLGSGRFIHRVVAPPKLQVHVVVSPPCSGTTDAADGRDSMTFEQARHEAVRCMNLSYHTHWSNLRQPAVPHSRTSLSPEQVKHRCNEHHRYAHQQLSDMRGYLRPT